MWHKCIHNCSMHVNNQHEDTFGGMGTHTLSGSGTNFNMIYHNPLKYSLLNIMSGDDTFSGSLFLVGVVDY